MAEIDIEARLRPFIDESDLGKKAPFFISLRTFEDGFDRAQGLIRTIASAWLLVSLAALGTVIANDAACLADLTQATEAGVAAARAPAAPLGGCNYPFGSLARSLILLMAALGITALWYLDQRVYQSLLHSVFVLGLKLEELDHQLPPVRTVLKALNREDITRRLSWFYQAPSLVLLGLQVVNLAMFFFLLHALVARRFGEAVADWELFLLIVLTSTAVLVQVIILIFAWRWPSLEPFLGNIDTLTFPPAPEPLPAGNSASSENSKPETPAPPPPR
jgi:hypothetical protein